MRQAIFLGVFLTLIAMLGYSSQVAIIKAQLTSLPLPVVVFMQSFIALLCMSPLMLKKTRTHGFAILKTKKIHLHLLRAIASLTISFGLFTAVKYIPLVNAMLLANTSPLMVPFIAFLFMGQQINHRLWLPLMVGFVGVVLVLQPNMHLFQPAALIALGAAFAMAVSLLLVRKLSATDSSETITFYFFLLSTIIAGFISIPYWSALTRDIWAILVLVGILYFITQYLMTYALRFASAQLVGILLYSNVLYSAMISIMFFHQIPNWMSEAGIVLTVIGGILCIRVEYINRQKPLATRPLIYAKANG